MGAEARRYKGEGETDDRGYYLVVLSVLLVYGSTRFVLLPTDLPIRLLYGYYTVTPIATVLALLY